MNFIEAVEGASEAGPFDPGPPAFDPGPNARTAGPLTRLRRSLATPRAAVVAVDGFDPLLTVPVAGPWTRLRRAGAAAVIDLPLPWPVRPGTDDLSGLGEVGDLGAPEGIAGAAWRAAPVAAALLGIVTAASVVSRPRSPVEPRTAVSGPASQEPIIKFAKPKVVPTYLAPGQVEARLVGDRASVPEDAPPALRGVVAAANDIKDRPYSYGGGHGSFVSSGYDCSGSVSYALHGGGLLGSPLASTSLESWGEPGPGKAITVYANGGHAYAVIAGLRWDTSGTGGSGPGWSTEMRSSSGYVARHPSGY